jgi:hypothetical protein
MPVMIKVYEDFDLSRVGHMQSVLTAAGIRTLLKNQYMSSVMGEIPFVEVLPELWVLDDREVARARQLIEEVLAQPAADQPPWNCPDCRIEVEGVFSHCWQCGRAHPGGITH